MPGGVGSGVGDDCGVGAGGEGGDVGVLPVFGVALVLGWGVLVVAGDGEGVAECEGCVGAVVVGGGGDGASHLGVVFGEVGGVDCLLGGLEEEGLEVLCFLLGCGVGLVVLEVVFDVFGDGVGGELGALFGVGV